MSDENVEMGWDELEEETQEESYDDDAPRSPQEVFKHAIANRPSLAAICPPGVFDAPVPAKRVAPLFDSESQKPSDTPPATEVSSNTPSVTTASSDNNQSLTDTEMVRISFLRELNRSARSRLETEELVELEHRLQESEKQKQNSELAQFKTSIDDAFRSIFDGNKIAEKYTTMLSILKSLSVPEDPGIHAMPTLLARIDNALGSMLGAYVPVVLQYHLISSLWEKALRGVQDIAGGLSEGGAKSRTISMFPELYEAFSVVSMYYKIASLVMERAETISKAVSRQLTAYQVIHHVGGE